MSISNEDFLEIQQLMYRYARCADQRNYAGFATVFTDDATLIFRGNAFAGLSTIQKVLTVPYLETLVQYAKGQIPGIPIFAPQGGTNHITVKSLSEAMLGALEYGESGKAYLVGDENLTWKEYLGEFFRSVGNETELEARDEEHPLFPDKILYAGRGSTVSYEPDAEETALLGCSRNNVKQAIREIVALVQ